MRILLVRVTDSGVDYKPSDSGRTLTLMKDGGEWASLTPTQQQSVLDRLWPGVEGPYEVRDHASLDLLDSGS